MLSKWSEVHPKVKIEGKKALLEKAKIQCKVGGTVYLKMYDKQEILDMVTIAKKDVYLDKEGKKGEDIPEGYRRLTETELNELGLSEELLHDNDNSGFYSQIYKDPNGDYVLAFRGSEPSPLAAGWRDFGKTNLPQGIGAYPEQYDRAAQIANILRDNGVTNVKITGHSLGGGLATYAGAITGYPTYVFNPAGVHDNTFKKGGVDRNKASHVQAFNDSNDVLNVWLQDNREVIIGGVGLGGAGLGSKFGPWGSLAGMVPAAYCYFTGVLPRSSGERMEIDTGSRGIMNSVDAHNMEGNNGLIEYFESMPESNTTVKAKNK